MEAGERVNALGTKKLFPLIVSMSIPAICELHYIMWLTDYL